MTGFPRTSAEYAGAGWASFAVPGSAWPSHDVRDSPHPAIVWCLPCTDGRYILAQQQYANPQIALAPLP
jgi:hypothetical protein